MLRATQRECEDLYELCFSEEHYDQCGQQIRNISDSCEIILDSDGTEYCNRNECIPAVAGFFYGSESFKYTKPFFECCEHQENCRGIPPEVYSPWTCLQADPFYSCNEVLEECMSDEGCKDSYKNITEFCPAEMFNTAMGGCPRKIPCSCEMHLRE